MKPAEITEAVLKSRLRMAAEVLIGATTDEEVNKLYDVGGFKDFVGVVDKATQVERLRAGHVARRLGHPQTGRVIMDGNT